MLSKKQNTAGIFFYMKFHHIIDIFGYIPGRPTFQIKKTIYLFCPPVRWATKKTRNIFFR